MEDISNNEDNRLIKALQQGNAHAFEEVFKKYHEPLYFHALNFVKSEPLAKDIVQEVFVKVWENRKRIKREGSFKAYLFTIGKHCIINLLKRATKESDIKQEIRMHALQEQSHPEDPTVWADYKNLADEALNQLPFKRKMVFMMFYKEGKKYDEIAQTLEISKHTVRDHIVKAEKTIKKYLELHAGVSFVLLLGLLLY